MTHISEQIEFLRDLIISKSAERSMIDRDWSEYADAEYIDIGNDISVINDIIETLLSSTQQ